MTPAQGNGANGSGLGPRNPETDKARLRAIHASVTAGDIASAAKMAEDALADGIDHVMVLSLVAGRREEEGRFEDSLGLLERAKAAAPGAVGVLNAIGLCLGWLGRREEAAAEFGAALAVDPGFAPALANRGMALIALARTVEAQRDFEAALAIEPDNLIAINGLAALALLRGDPAEARRLATQVTERQPDYPEALTTLAGADIAEGKAGVGEARLRVLLADQRLQSPDRANAQSVLGDALDAQDRFAEAFEAYEAGNRLRRAHFAPQYDGRQGTLGLVRELTGALRGKRVAATWGRSTSGPARHHLFLVGFSGSCATLLEQVLSSHPDVTIMTEKECLVDSTRAWMADAADIAQFCDAPDEELDTYRAAYWRRVAEEGADPAGRLFVDSNPFNTFKLPLIARLFPEARILFMRRDPRDTVLSCFSHRFQMSDPAYQMLTLEGAAELYAATMAMAETTEQAFGLFMHPCKLEKIIADFDTEMRAIGDFVGIESMPQLAEGLGTQDLGKWRDYEGEMAEVLPILQPWIDRFGY